MEVRQKNLEARRVSLPPVDFGGMEGRTAASLTNVFTGAAVAADAAGVGGKEEQEMDVAPAVAEEGGEGEGGEEAVVGGGKRKRGGGQGQGQQQPEGRLIAKARPVMRGHTAFLTFAVRRLGGEKGKGEGEGNWEGAAGVEVAPEA